MDLNPSAVTAFVADALANYCYDLPGNTKGDAWSAERIAGNIEELRAHLVVPRLVAVTVRDTSAQVRSETPVFTDAWVVADDTKGYVVCFDPSNFEFFLAFVRGSAVESFGVRGDLVGVYCAR